MGQGSTARRPIGKQIAYLDPITITYATANIATGVKVGTLPRGSIPFAFHRNTAFTAAGTRVLTVGTNSADYNNIISTVTEETASTNTHLIGFAVDLTQDADVYVKMTTTGTVATTGRATILVAYIPPAELT